LTLPFRFVKNVLINGAKATKLGNTKKTIRLVGIIRYGVVLRRLSLMYGVMTGPQENSILVTKLPTPEKKKRCAARKGLHTPPINIQKTERSPSPLRFDDYVETAPHMPSNGRAKIVRYG
jgi:hypothetical protein